ncbi:TPA: acylphosphatase, partial [Streptococcus pyogenes MGAS3370]|nr:acylphosphatase [Streptococcus pyogenes MGAS3370]
EVRKGPSKWAKVTYVDVTMANFEDFQDFQIGN